MSIDLRFVIVTVAMVVIVGCQPSKEQREAAADMDTTVQTKFEQQVNLPAPYATKSMKNFSKVIGWKVDQFPKAPNGFVVTRFADGLSNPRWLYVTDAGDVLVAEANTEVKGIKKVATELSAKAKSQNLGESANRITLLRDDDSDGKAEVKQVLLDKLNQPFGMVVFRDMLYVANTDGVVQFPYSRGHSKKITAAGKKIMALPAGGYNNHWTRNIILSSDSTKLFIAVGSASNVGEHGMEEERRRACILEVNLDGSSERIFASGLRNPVGIALHPETKRLYAAVNERDELGDDLVPDYLTVVKEGGFYGWPYAYFGKNEDPRLKGVEPNLVAQSITPDVSLGSHTASLGLAFNDHNNFPKQYYHGAFIGQHGSWNRSALVGYKVVFVPFKNGLPAGPPEDFLTGFIADHEKGEVYGRPVGIAFLRDGAMLVADDASNVIWHVAYKP
ncbi:PQQ-dependent sugar dehydrogenase [Pseudochryseolinea flava]|uniref:Sorbosone dehydrogenase family protein n=1 Tax=Pseudochryseolinea flava TaxID=2059302 RepID=A0A364Y0J4_9BACT|nr:sorbosone dehydrogenase family protein [Pseudochryseolinea flava]RAW00118.1 sorbosone dehydrogenase family protein [Pseudochryseolinea flava]